MSDTIPNVEEMDPDRCQRLVAALIKAVNVFYGEELGHNADGRPYVHGMEVISATAGVAGMIIGEAPDAFQGNLFEMLVQTASVNSGLKVEAQEVPSLSPGTLN